MFLCCCVLPHTLLITDFLLSWFLKSLLTMYVQGVRLERSESYCLLLLKYENYGLFNLTGGSPDVVHLIK